MKRLHSPRSWPRLLLWAHAISVFGFYLTLWRRTAPPQSRQHRAAPPPTSDHITVSIIVPARNEERNIRRCVTSLLEQEIAANESYEVLVVDDGSTDETERMLEEIARAHPHADRLRVLRLDELPAGWAGKPHALHTGVQQTRGDWLLFTDADTWHAPQALHTALTEAIKANVDLFSFGSQQELPGFWEKVMMPMAYLGISMQYPPKLVNDPNSPICALQHIRFSIASGGQGSVDTNATAWYTPLPSISHLLGMGGMLLMDVSPFLPLCEGLVVECVEHTATTLTIAVVSTSLVASCPQCQEPSDHLHGHYQRTVADLPCSGRQVTLRLKVHKFVCLNLACPRVIFAERLPGLVQPRARHTIRLLAALRSLGFATSGEAAARLAPKVGMQVSPSTLLRRIKDASLPLPTHTITKVGLDDFALRRGLTYGTIIVDLETHQILDLLPDRTAATVISWLQAHPQIDLISRDRGKDYATAARLGAPQAVQVADRWHLHHNLSETLRLLFARHWTEIKHASRALAPTPAAEVEPAPGPEEAVKATTAPPVPFVLGHAYRAPKIQALQDARRAQRLACYEQVVTLRNQHVTPAEIATHLGISTRTVARWLAQDGFPEARQRRRRSSPLDPYETYVVCRWQAGCHQGAQLWRELVSQGYTGSPQSLYHFLARLPAPPPKPKPNPSRPKRMKPPPGPYDHLSTKQVVWLFMRPPAELRQAEQETCAFLRQVHLLAQSLLVKELSLGHRRALHHRYLSLFTAFLWRTTQALAEICQARPDQRIATAQMVV